MTDDEEKRDEEQEGHRYRLLWNVELNRKGLLREELPAGWGACDAAVICSILYPEDGSYSVKVLPFDGRDPATPLSDKEVFKAWWLVAKHLADSPSLDEGRRSFAQMVWETWAETVLRNQPGGDGAA